MSKIKYSLLFVIICSNTGIHYQVESTNTFPLLLSNVSCLIADEEEDDEEVYKMAGVMAQCGGLECMLNRLSGIKDFKQGRHLLTVNYIYLAKINLNCCVTEANAAFFNSYVIYILV